MKNRQKGFIVPLVITIIAVLAIGGYIYVYQNNKVVTQVPSNLENTTSTNLNPSQEAQLDSSEQTKPAPVSTTKAKVANCGLNVTSVSPNTKVSFPVTISGTVNNSTGCHWSMFEGQAGTAQLYFNYQNEGWKILGVSTPVKVSDWTADNTQFSVTLNFNNGGIGLPSGTPMKILFSAENASGLVNNAKTFEFPIILK